jgi:hypothetical protein
MSLSASTVSRGLQCDPSVEGAGVETLQTVERTTFIERPHRTIGEMT